MYINKDAAEYIRNALNIPSNNPNWISILVYKLKKKFGMRLLAVRAFQKKEITLSLLCWLMFPKKFRPQKVNTKIKEIDSLRADKLNLLLHQINEDKIETFREIVIEDQYNVSKLIKNNFVVLDVGSNIGVFSFLAHFFAPESIIYAFEPSQKVFNILFENINKNKVQDKIIPIKKALGDKQRKDMLMIEENSLGVSNILKTSSFIVGREETYTKGEEVEVDTIDHFVQEEKLNSVDFIKIDTEGYEKEIILGATHTIQNFSPIITCSAYHLEYDTKKIPELINLINPLYKFRLSRTKKGEEVLIFWVESK